MPTAISILKVTLIFKSQKNTFFPSSPAQTHPLCIDKQTPLNSAVKGELYPAMKDFTFFINTGKDVGSFSASSRISFLLSFTNNIHGFKTAVQKNRDPFYHISEPPIKAVTIYWH